MRDEVTTGALDAFVKAHPWAGVLLMLLLCLMVCTADRWWS